MDPWLRYPGYPIINISHNREKKTTRIRQTNILDNYSKLLRTIPINYATKSNPNFSTAEPIIWMQQNESSITLPNVETDDWIILNIQQLSKYIVYKYTHMINLLKYYPNLVTSIQMSTSLYGCPWRFRITVFE